MDSAAGVPPSTDETAGFQGRLIIDELVDDTVAKLRGKVYHDVGGGDDGGEEQGVTVTEWCDQCCRVTADSAGNFFSFAAGNAGGR
jgi:hypothetical protein